jgi:hypothetical protein
MEVLKSARPGEPPKKPRPSPSAFSSFVISHPSLFGEDSPVRSDTIGFLARLALDSAR